MKEKQLKIPQQLFDLMVAYIYDHYDEFDRTRFEKIHSGVNRKIEACLRHAAYSIAKSHPDSAERERARQMYLDMVGITESFRWPEGWTSSQPFDLLENMEDLNA